MVDRASMPGKDSANTLKCLCAERTFTITNLDKCIYTLKSRKPVSVQLPCESSLESFNVVTRLKILNLHYQIGIMKVKWDPSHANIYTVTCEEEINWRDSPVDGG